VIGRLARWLVITSALTAVLVALAGRVDLPRLWAYAALCYATGLIAVLRLDPDVVRERLKRGHQTADPVRLLLIRSLSAAHVAVGVLDIGRVHWTDTVAMPISVAALALMAVSFRITFGAIAANRFFVPQLRLQRERGHHVVDTGPYARVRHPGYAGMLLLGPASGLALGSWASFAVGILASAAFVYRAAGEDAFLRSNLEGYLDYTRRVRYRLVPGVWAVALLVVAAPAAAQDTTRVQDTAQAQRPRRPFVEGGVYDKPYLTRLLGRTAIGGYAEAHARWERVDGATDEAGFLLRRWNIFTATQVSDFVRIGAELEFEEGGEEITVEFAAIDVGIHPALSLRAGMLLSPLGKFNLAHDSPRNEFVDRPLVSTELIGVALSEPGLGFFGLVPLAGGARFTYELYAVNGYHDGLITASQEGTRIPLGRRNFEDNNASPAFVGRLTFSPRIGVELGVSGHHGAYNVFRSEGLDVDRRRDLSIWVVDGEATMASVKLQGEAALVRVDVPPGLTGLYASRQRGLYLQALRPFGRGLVGTMPESFFAAAARLDVVDFDADLPGDMIRQVSLGVNFRPSQDTALKLDWVRGRSRDRFNNPSDHAALLFSVATYF
jgi:protein-S-isoprenylcysteine O-methyltransferase Ste14